MLKILAESMTGLMKLNKDKTDTDYRGQAFVLPPKKIPLFIRIGTWFAEKKTRKHMIVPRILAWYPKAALSSGVLEAFITHHDKQVSDRLLQLIRFQVSVLIGCPFCMDMNRDEFEKNVIKINEINAIEQHADLNTVPSFSKKEMLALSYAKMLTATPVQIDQNIMNGLKESFTEREIVILTTTISQVNYWARMIKGFGVPVACSISLS